MSEDCNRFETFAWHNHAWRGMNFAVVLPKSGSASWLSQSYEKG